MSARFEELDWQQTPIGEISLRRRLEPSLGVEVYEVLLGDEFLMSSLFTRAEEELARLSLAELDRALPGRTRPEATRPEATRPEATRPEATGPDRTGSERTGLRVLVGGLGLGFTARTVLEDPRVVSLHVIERLSAVIGWHTRGLLPFAGTLISDPRCTLDEADFFAVITSPESGPDGPGAWDAILVDIDHSPAHVLHPSHTAFYTAPSLRHLAGLLAPGGVFGLWSDDPPDNDFVWLLRDVFTSAVARVVTFPNHYTGAKSANTVYVCRR